MTSVPAIIALANETRDYAWGSATAIPRLLGTAPPGGPVAELWVGAHPDAPSRWLDSPQRNPLTDLIAADPGYLLGEASLERFGPRLPFLFKVLAAERALSIQVHPTAEQAAVGYAAENEAGVPFSSADRNYRDAHHKPELACAITEFDALCGFRPVSQTLRLLDALAVAELAPYRELLAGEDGLRATFTTLLSLPELARLKLLDGLAAGCRRLAAASGEWQATARVVLQAGLDYPGDIGAALALLLNHVRLLPGEAIFLGAGNVHAYLRGVCVEILANSDNVLRCGLTSKHVDIPELLRVADFQPLPQPRWRPVAEPDSETAGSRATGSGVTGSRTSFAPPVADFRLTVLEPAGVPEPLGLSGPKIVLCAGGRIELAAGADRRTLDRGESAFVAAAADCKIGGQGRAYVATTNLDDAPATN